MTTILFGIAVMVLGILVFAVRRNPTNRRLVNQSREPGSANGLCSPAWLLRGISSIPGELILNDSRISFIAQDPGSAWDWQLEKLERVSGSHGFVQALKRGTAVLLFNEPLAEIGVRSPWYYFSGGLVLQIRDKSYRVSFGGPAGSSSASDEFRAVSAMRQIGKRWLQALATQRAGGHLTRRGA